MLGLNLDRRKGGTMHTDRMNRILGVCHGARMYTTDNTGAQPRIVPEVRAVEEVIETPQYHKYGLHVNPKHLRKVRSLAGEFALALNVPRVAVEVDGDTVYVRVPREEQPAGVSFEQAWALAPDIAPGALLLGVDESGDQLCLDTALAGNVHIGVVGMTGSGKSTLMQTMALSALMSAQTVALLDPTLRRTSTLWPLSGHPGVWRGGLYSEIADIERALTLLADYDAAPLFVFVDEVPELCRKSPAIREELLALAQTGRKAGVHLALGAQNVDDQVRLFGELGVRLVGQVTDAGAAYRAGCPGAENLKGGGDFIAKSARGRTHFQAAMGGAALLRQWAATYPPCEGEPFTHAGYAPSPTRAAVPVSKSAPVVQAMQSTAPLEVELQGRGLEPIPRAVIHDIIRYRSREGRWPSLHYCQSWLHYANRRTKRAVNLACIRLHMPLAYPQWRDDYKVENLKLEVGG